MRVYVFYPDRSQGVIENVLEIENRNDGGAEKFVLTVAGGGECNLDRRCQLMVT